MDNYVRGDNGCECDDFPWAFCCKCRKKVFEKCHECGCMKKIGRRICERKVDETNEKYKFFIRNRPYKRIDFILKISCLASYWSLLMFVPEGIYYYLACLSGASCLAFILVLWKFLIRPKLLKGWMSRRKEEYKKAFSEKFPK